ncbi:MAG: Mobile element protein [Proteobacteria bacterium]|nr:Mobile element protein [Pseudomonadota bacterium]
MDEKKLKPLAAELAKGLKTEADLNQFSRMLTKLTVETALNAELTAPACVKVMVRQASLQQQATSSTLVSS